MLFLAALGAFSALTSPFFLVGKAGGLQLPEAVQTELCSVSLPLVLLACGFPKSRGIQEARVALAQITQLLPCHSSTRSCI